jgi:hypothetical protein
MKTSSVIIAGAWLCIVCCPCASRADSNVGKAKTDVLTLEKAVLAWQTRHDVFPVSLKVLAECQPDGGAAYIKENMLVDPWGRPYQYDTTRLHPETGVPLIWSDGAEPGNPRSKIANWRAEHLPPLSFWEEISDPGTWLLPLIAHVAIVMFSLVYVRTQCLYDAVVRSPSGRIGQAVIEKLIILLAVGLFIVGVYYLAMPRCLYG